MWADNGKGKLEKRKIELGEYDEELGEYKIKSGLKAEDYIAWPQEGLEEGMKTTKDASEAMESLENESEEIPEESFEDENFEEEPVEDGSMKEESAEDEKVLKEQ